MALLMPKDEYSLLDSDGSVQVINSTDVDTDRVMSQLRSSPEVAALSKWAAETQGSGGDGRRRQGSLFERDRYVTPASVFAQIELAREAAENDDIVSSVLEATEALAFSKMSIDCEDTDEADVWNQIAADLDLDSRLREIFRETFMVSQAYIALWWGRKSYKVSGKTDKGVKRKRTFDNLVVPLGLSILDPLKVMPVGNFMFNQDQLVYIADRTEADVIDSYLLGHSTPGADPVITQLIAGRYEAGVRERKQLGEYGVDATNLYTLNPRNVFRHTATRSQYERFANVRMKSVFELLDLKHQLRQMDRAHLIGGTNFIVLIKKGTDDHPAQPEEIANLQNQVRTVARVPVIVGDHRLTVEIVTPKQDNTLDPSRSSGLDVRIAGRLFGSIVASGGSNGNRGDDSIKVARIIARGLESRRHMQRRTLEQKVLTPAFEANEAFTEKPKLRFYPKRIALDFDPAVANFLLDLFDGGNLSRDSILSEVDYSESDEARKRELEKDKYDDIFLPAVLPAGSPGLSAPGAKNPKTEGRTKGGSRSGGGAAPGTGQGQEPRNPRRRADGKPKPSTAELLDGVPDEEDTD